MRGACPNPCIRPSAVCRLFHSYELTGLLVTLLNDKALHHKSDEGLCAQDWIRTSTSLRTLRPEHSASTNFATWAGLQMYMKVLRRKTGPGTQFIHSQ